jgi:hypothetical protein
MTHSNWIDILTKIGRRLGRPDILFWTLPWLIILITIGTIDQKYIGLYAAQHKYFSSFIWWFQGVIPLPAGYTVLSVMTVNVTCKFLFLSYWTKDKAGINIIHFSIIVLMIGGLLTAATMKEGYIALKPTQTDHIIRDYHDRVLVLESEGQTLQIPFNEIGKTDLPIAIDIVQKCANTAIRARADLDNNNGVGAASMAELVCIDKFVENERNIAGLTYRNDGAEYIVFEGRETHDEVGGYTIKLDRAMRQLPFDVTLQSFLRDVYPGTDKPRAYESRVTITDGDVIWPALISMNEPLRYGGYTFYQASTLIDQDGQPISVLSVVTNTGWVFPYVSGILLALGLVWHLIIRMRGRGNA